MAAREDLRRERLSWMLVLALGAAITALMLSGCASGEAQASRAPQTPQTEQARSTAHAAPGEPVTSGAAPTAAPAGAPAARPEPRPATDFQWPDPLPACAPEVPPLFKGLVIGTWVPEGEAGFDQDWIDERSVREAWTRATQNRRAWKGFSVVDATVNLDTLLADRSGPAVGYAFSLVSRTAGGLEVEDAPAILHVRHRGRLRAYFDGLPVLDLQPPADGAWGEARVPLVLSGPYAVLLLKVGRGSAALGSSMNVEVRVSAPDGSALPGQTWNTMRPGMPPAEG